MINFGSGSTVIKSKIISRRMFLLTVSKAVIFTGIFVRLISLQINEENKYKTLSDKNRFREWKLAPKRGVIKDYFNNTTNAVKTNIIAKIYSVIFLALVFLINILKLFPKIAQIHIEGKQTMAAVVTRNIVAIIKFSSVGKKPDATVIATVQAFGFIN